MIYSQLDGDARIIYKKTTNTSLGLGVKKYVLDTEKDIHELVNKCADKGEFLFQKCVDQHDFLQQFNKSSVNIIRIITFRHNGEYHLLSSSLRYGMDGSTTDVAFVNGEEVVNVVGIDDRGIIKDRLYGVNGQKDFSVYNLIENKTVPHFEDLKKAAIEGHKHLAHFDHVAWDFTIDKDGNPICIEYNINNPGTQLYQFANGPLYGSLTDDVLELLKMNCARDNIPSKFKTNI